MSTQTKPTAIVIGAGVGGIATAARLAHAGYQVTVYEKNEFAGGRCSLIHHEGYRFDQGPSLLLLPPLFHQLYNDLGEKLEDHIELIQCNPNYIIHYHDGEKIMLTSNRAQMEQEAEKWDGPGGAKRLEGFLAEARKHGEVSYDQVLGKNFPSIFSILRPKFFMHVLDLHPFATVYGRCARWFKTERMRRAFSFASMYLGSSPFDAPGTYSLLQWSETCEGIWYPKGGFYQVPASVKRIAEKNGAKFHLSTPVKCVTYDSNNKATGVLLVNGQKHNADVVVVNSDLTWSYNNLFVKEGEEGTGKTLADANSNGTPVSKKELLDPKKANSLVQKPHSCSSISFYWAMDRKLDDLKGHNIFLAEEYKASFDDIFRDRSMPREPSFYINVPSRIDPTAAPEGKDSLVVLVPVGHLSPGKKGSDPDDEGADQDWPGLVERARKQIIEIVEERLGITGLKDMILWEEVNTPLTWREKFNLTHGSILGITHDFFNVLSFRHQSRHPKLSGAYFVGASAHPGTGVPIAIAGSKLCAETIMRDSGINLPSTYTAKPPVATSDLDRPRSQNLIHYFERTVLGLAPFVTGALIASSILAIAALATGLITLPAIIKFLGLESHVARYLPSYGLEGAQGWEKYSPLSAKSNGLLGSYGWTAPIILLNLVMAYMTLSGAGKKAQPVAYKAGREEVVGMPVPIDARKPVMVGHKGAVGMPVPIDANGPVLARAL